MGMNINLPELSKAELTPAVVELLAIAQELAQRVHLQEEEVTVHRVAGHHESVIADARLELAVPLR